MTVTEYDLHATGMILLDAGFNYVHRQIHGFGGCLVSSMDSPGVKLIFLRRTPEESKCLLYACVEYIATQWQRVEGEL